MNFSFCQTKKDKCNVCRESRIGYLEKEEYKARESAKKEVRSENNADKACVARGESNYYTADL